MKRSSVSKRIAMGLFATALNVHSIVALADASIAGGQSIPPPKDADEIVKNLRDIIDHGDLADEQYFADKLGVVMKGGEIGWMTVPIPCGGTSDPYSHALRRSVKFFVRHLHLTTTIIPRPPVDNDAAPQHEAVDSPPRLAVPSLPTGSPRASPSA